MSTHRVFLCHDSNDSDFVIQVARFLRIGGLEVFYYEDPKVNWGNFKKRLRENLKETNYLVFIGRAGLTKCQKKELEVMINAQVKQINDREYEAIVIFIERDKQPKDIQEDVMSCLEWLTRSLEIPVNKKNSEIAADIAKKVLLKLNVKFDKTLNEELNKALKEEFDKEMAKALEDNDKTGLPKDPHLFSYEKDIIAFFREKVQIDQTLYTDPKYSEMRKKLKNGCPSDWPQVERWKQNLKEYTNCGQIERWKSRGSYTNELSGAGKFRSGMVMAAALSDFHMKEDETSKTCMMRQGLCFPEAGPRGELYFPPREGIDNLNVAILVSGGIAPGINAVIDGIVQRHWKYARDHRKTNGLNIFGIRNGFSGLHEEMAGSFITLVPDREERPEIADRIVTSDYANGGGSMLGTSRMDDLLQTDHPLPRLTALTTIARILTHFHRTDILYVIGGDGSMKAAHALWSLSRNSLRGRPLSVVAIPKTMDNDILWVWQAFGFLSAVEKAREVIKHLHTEVSSNPRLGIIQLFGSDSGFVVSHSVLASPTGHCDVALIPEVPFSMTALARWVKYKMCKRGNLIPHGLIVMAETAIPVDALRYASPEGEEPEIDVGLSREEQDEIIKFQKMRNAGKRIQGQTNDCLRTAGLKIVSRGLPILLPKNEIEGIRGVHINWQKLRILTNEPRHLLRSISPSCSDVIFGQRMGMLAVDNAMAGYTDFMISQWLTEYVLVPLKLVVLGRKRIPPGGIFWRSVLAKTGQPEDMVTPSLP